MQISLRDSVFISFRYIPRSGIAGSYGNSISSFLRKLHTAFHSSCTRLHSHQQCTIPFSPHPHQNLFLVSLIIAILTVVKLYLIMVFWFAFLWWLTMISEYLFMYPLAICMAFLEKCLFRTSVHFLIRLLAFLLLSFISSLYILDINPLSNIWFANIFSHSLGYLSILSIVSFVVQKLLVWCSPTCLFLLLLTWLLESGPKSHHQD